MDDSMRITTQFIKQQRISCFPRYEFVLFLKQTKDDEMLMDSDNADVLQHKPSAEIVKLYGQSGGREA
jgi:hypothetical protein